MRPIENVLQRLPEYSQSGKGFKAPCPAHDDKKPSLSVTEAEDGRVLLMCHAGCSTENVIEALNLSWKDLSPDQETTPFAPQSKQTFYPEPRQAIAAYKRGEPTKQWKYLNNDGEEVFRILRWDNNAGKEVRPISQTSSGWTLSTMPAPRPLLNLPSLIAYKKSPVYVVEGEKCVDALFSFGLIATTSSGGANAANQTDWSPLSGRRVIIIPDNDAGGKQYAEDVLQILIGMKAAVSIAYLDNTPEGGDVVDLINLCSCDDEKTGLREEIMMLPDKLEQVPLPTLLDKHSDDSDYIPFPVNAFPQIVADFISESAAATGCDTAFIALPVLTLLGAAIGNSRRLRVKTTYEVPAILWTGIVGESGSGKTPALRTALSAAFEREHLLQRKNTGERFLVADTTTEALVETMATNERGIFCVRDELAGWFGSIDRYTERKKGCSSDQSFLLSTHEGIQHSVDRKTGDKRHLFIPRASLWVTGGIQPGILAQAMGKQEREAGLLARLLLACPPAKPHKFTDEDVAKKTQEDFNGLLNNLFELQGENTVGLTPTAKSLWVSFHDQTSEESQSLKGDLAAAWSKFRDTALRIALIIHFTNNNTTDISIETMKDALRITRWFMQETRRVYALIGGKTWHSGHNQQKQVLLEWMRNRDWVTARDVQRGPRQLRDAKAAELCLKQLVEDGVLDRKFRDIGQHGGKPAELFRLKTSGELQSLAT